MVEVGNRTLSFNARRNADGEVSGRFEYHQVVEGEAFKFNVSVTCLQVYDGNRAKIGGLIEVSNDPTIEAGTYAWFSVFDNGEGAGASPDHSSLIGFGDEAANEAFCSSPNLPRFGPGTSRGTCRYAASQEDSARRVTPVWRLKARVKWLWSAKPCSTAIRASGASVPARVTAAQSSRTLRT